MTAHKLLTFLVVLLVSIFGIWLYYQSTLFKRQADELLKYGRAEEAISLYQKAQSTFPLRSDLAADIEGAKLILKSNQDFEQISIFAEFQQPPPLANLPSITLQPNEVFVPMLMYHQIRINPQPANPILTALSVSTDQLNEQFSYLVSHNYHTITLDQLADALDGKISLPENPIILTFDDGYRNFYENAFPLLKKYQLKATVFIITRVLDIQPYLISNQIMEMDKSGLVEFGAHTRHHPNLPELSSQAIVDEIRGSKIDLEQRLKKPINWFAYPYGSYNSFIMQTVRAVGFKGAASTVYGAVQSKDNLYLAPRIMVDGRFTLDNLIRRIRR